VAAVVGSGSSGGDGGWWIADVYSIITVRSCSSRGFTSPKLLFATLSVGKLIRVHASPNDPGLRIGGQEAAGPACEADFPA